MRTFPPDAVLKDVPSFPSDLEYSQDSYRGRFLHFLSMTNPSTLLTTPTKLAASENLLKKVQQRAPGWQNTPVAAYQDAQRRVRAIVHPETQRPILLPFRFAAFVPMNFFNLCGMLAPSQQTAARAMFWQFSNQTYNVGFNYCNGSGKTGLPLHELLLGYSAATLTACGLSYSLGKLATAPSTGAAAARPQLWRLFIPYTAVACANIANLAVIRFRDLFRGIPVKDAASGEELCGGAPSPAAGRLAVAQVALSRVLLPVPLMLFPPIFMNFLFNPLTGVKYFARRRAQLYIPVNVLSLVSVLCVVLPMCIAIFPQNTVVPARWLEPAFRNQKNARGEVIEKVVFNKGL